MTKKTLTIPALALSILLLSAVLAPAAFAKGTGTAARSTPAAVAIDTAPLGLGQTVVNLVLALLGVGSAVITGVDGGLNAGIGFASTDPTVIAQSLAAAEANATATEASASAAVASSVAAGMFVGKVLSQLGHALSGSS